MLGDNFYDNQVPDIPRQGLKVCRPEEIAYRSGYIDAAQLEKLAHAMGSSAYGSYLRDLLRERA